jgi:hypothetical protein
MSCLFQSLSSYVSHQDYSKLRQDICDFLETNPTILDDMPLDKMVELDGVSIQDYIKHMRSNATWGGAIEIKSFCEMYQVNVLVLNIRNNQTDMETTTKEIKFLSSVPSQRWVSITWNGGHFEPINIEIINSEEKIENKEE